VSEHTPNTALGLNQLSTEEIVQLHEFINKCGMGDDDPAHKVFMDELRGLANQDAVKASTVANELAGSRYPNERRLACEIVPLLATVDVDAGCSVWEDLCAVRIWTLQPKGLPARGLARLLEASRVSSRVQLDHIHNAGRGLREGHRLGMCSRAPTTHCPKANSRFGTTISLSQKQGNTLCKKPGLSP
jgi:hypothetical protein